MGDRELADALLAPDTMVDHFRVVRLLGQGGMGEVYLARDTRLGRRVALKFVHARHVHSRHAAGRFLREARATASLSHPNIVTVYAVGKHNGRPYLALEYLEGQNLRQRLQEERPGPREATRIGLAIALALAEAHRHHILHRDLKPENILLAKDGRPRLLDLGLAKILEARSDQRHEHSKGRKGHEPEARDDLTTIRVSADDLAENGGAGDGARVDAGDDAGVGVGVGVEVAAAGGDAGAGDAAGAELGNDCCRASERCQPPDPDYAVGRMLAAAPTISLGSCFTVRNRNRARARARARNRARNRARKHCAFLPVKGSVRVKECKASLTGALAAGGAAMDGMVLSVAGQVLGTPGYIAPERMLGQPSSAAADVWALGVILFELLTGCRPFKDRRAESEAQSTEPDMLPELPSTASPELARLSFRCLDDSPAARPPAAEVAAALEGMLGENKRQLGAEQSPFRGLLPFSERHSEVFFGRESEIDSFLELVREQAVLPVVGPSGAGKSSFVQAGIIPRLREQGAWMVLALRPGSDPFTMLAARLERGESVFRSATTGGSMETADVRSARTRARAKATPTPPPLSLWENERDRARDGDRDGAHSAAGTPTTTSTPIPVPIPPSSAAAQDPRSDYLAVTPTAAATPLDAQVATSIDVPIATATATPTDMLAATPTTTPVGGTTGPTMATAGEHQPEERSVFVFPRGRATPAADSPVAPATVDSPPALLAPSAAAPANVVAARASSATSRAQLVARLRESPQLLNVFLHDLAARERCRVLLFVDQLEEACTLVADEKERRAFLRAVCTAADDHQGPVRVVFTVRDDFLGRIAEGAEVRAVLGRAVVMRSPDRNALEEILVRPLAVAGYCFDDPALPAEMTAAVADEPSSLPLLQFTGRLLWDRRDQTRKMICRSVYERAGGVAGALAEHADAVLAGLAPAELRVARDLLLRMVTPERARRVVPLNVVLDGLPEVAKEILERLTQARLVTVRRAEAVAHGTAVLELVHESLVRTWHRLARWLEESREEVAFMTELGQAADLWVRRGRRASEAWYGPALAEALVALRRYQVTVPAIVAEFLAAGRRREERARWRRQALVAGAGALLLAVAIVAVFAARRSESQRRAAEAQKAEALRESAMGALARAELVEARAKLRSSLEHSDSLLGRAVWWKLEASPQLWRHQLAGPVYDVAFSPDGKTVAAGCMDGLAHLVDVNTLAERALAGLDTPIEAVAFSPEGKYLAGGGLDGSLGLWELATGELTMLRGHTANVKDVEFSAGGTLLASASFDGTARLWRVPAGSVERVLAGHADQVWSVAFSPDGRLLASADRSGAVRLWQPQVGTELAGLPVPGHAVAFSPDRPLLAISHESSIAVWDLVANRQLASETSHGGVVRRLAFAAGGLLASASNDQTVRLRIARTDMGAGTSTVVLRHDSEARSVAFSLDGSLLVSGGIDQTIRLARLDSSSQRTGPLTAHQSAAGHSGPVIGLAFSPDGTTLASASADATARLWDVDQGRQRLVINGQVGRLQGAAFSPDGKLVAAGSFDSMVRIWDARSGAVVQALPGHRGRVLQVAFLPAGGLLASASDGDRTVRVWDLATGTTVRVLTEAGQVPFLVTAPDGTATMAQLGQLWDLATGQPALAFPGDSQCLAVATNGKTVLARRRADRSLWQSLW
ncbi:MAG: protein kinase, partial [Pseudomonadota bacterium]